MTAVIEVLKKFGSYLVERKYKIVTECSAFQKTLDKKEFIAESSKVSLFVEAIDYEIEHISATKVKHVVALISYIDETRSVIMITRLQPDITLHK